MNLTIHELGQTTWARLAWAQIWQVALVALAVGLVVRLACRHRPQLAYLLWMLVVVKSLTPPLVSSPSGVFSWVQAETRPATAARSAPGSKPLSQESLETNRLSSVHSIS